MKISFHDKFYESDYAHDGASIPGRMEAIMTVIGAERTFEIIRPHPANEEDVLLAHTLHYLDTVKSNGKLYDMAMLAAGGAITAADIALTGEPAFACLRPPGHHASRESAWGYCVFCNMGIALLKLKQQRKIESAFVLDFDAHTGDGTKDVLSNWKECRILNPYAENNQSYIQEIQDFMKEISSVDIIGVCAGFDSYEKDVGRKLTAFDFYSIGVLMKQFAKRAASGRRFAILEGGYYLPDLGKNVLAFCQGFA
ncbi:MAG: histone deacetylase family protein [Proteobacteria bacterium]|nr:histone deacetylase family protein [Pseudomonadota bacterium]